MNFRITHTTEYLYLGKVSLCYNDLHLKPRDFPGQICEGFELKIEPQPRTLDEKIDFFGNPTHFFSIEKPHNQMKVTSVSKVRRIIENYNQLSIEESQPWEMVRDQVKSSAGQMADVRQYVYDSPFIVANSELENYARKFFTPGRSLFESVFNLMQGIFNEFEFTPGFSDVSTPLSEVFKCKKGVCQDFAHLAIACIRSLELPARYVSGYIETLPPPGKPRLVGADASHAWFSVYIPGMGWVDFDPTNNKLAGPDHIITAWGRDYSDVAPMKGIIFSSGVAEMKVSVDVHNLQGSGVAG